MAQRKAKYIINNPFVYQIIQKLMSGTFSEIILLKKTSKNQT